MPVWETYKVGRTRRGKPVYGFVPSAQLFTTVTDESDSFFYINIAGFYINNNQLLLHDGTINSPGLAFLNDTDTGIRRYTTDISGHADVVEFLLNSDPKIVLSDGPVIDQIELNSPVICTEGIELAISDLTMTFGANITAGLSSGSKLRPDGGTADTAASPAYAFNVDTATGMFLDGSAGLGFSFAGNRELRIAKDAVIADGGFYSLVFGEPIYDGGSVPMTGQLRLADGSAAAPSLTFKTSTNMGIYKATSGIGLAVSGLSVATVDSNNFNISGALKVSDSSDSGNEIAGNVTFAETFSNNTITIGSALDANTHIENNDGTAGSPSYSFRNDDDTGVYRISDNKLGIAAHGKRQLIVTRESVFAEGGFYSVAFGEPLYGFNARETGGRDSYDNLNSLEFEHSFFYVTKSSNARRAVINFIPPTTKQVSQLETKSNSSTRIFTHTIPANYLNTVGGVRVRLHCTYLNSSGGNVSLTFTMGLGTTTMWQDSAIFSSGAGTRAGIIDIILANRGAANNQMICGSIFFSGNGGATTGSGDFAGSAVTQGALFGTAAEDTTSDKDLFVNLTLSVADTSTFTVQHALIEKI